MFEQLYLFSFFIELRSHNYAFYICIFVCMYVGICITANSVLLIVTRSKCMEYVISVIIVITGNFVRTMHFFVIRFCVCLFALWKCYL